MQKSSITKIQTKMTNHELFSNKLKTIHLSRLTCVIDRGSPTPLCKTQSRKNIWPFQALFMRWSGESFLHHLHYCFFNHPSTSSPFPWCYLLVTLIFFCLQNQDNRPPGLPVLQSQPPFLPECQVTNECDITHLNKVLTSTRGGESRLLGHHFP